MPDEIQDTDKLSMEDEKAELEAVLASSLFVRTPSLANLLSYLCQRYFQGESDQLKEYTIGVEAFGRAPDFDKKEDSIVRVEIRLYPVRFQTGPKLRSDLCHRSDP